MSVRPVDMQTVIPKLPEVQKAKSVENEIEKNNLYINIHKDQQQIEKNTKQVVKKEKPEGKRIDREGRQKNENGKQQNKSREELSEEKEGQKKEDKRVSLPRIDIRI